MNACNWPWQSSEKTVASDEGQRTVEHKTSSKMRKGPLAVGAAAEDPEDSGVGGNTGIRSALRCDAMAA
jgi:hypothetical protein